MTSSGQYTGATLPLRGAARQDDDINLGHMFQVIWRGKFWVMLAMLVFAALGIYYALRVAERSFQTTAVIEFTPTDTNFLDLESIVTGTSKDTASLKTELAIVQSREMIEQLIERLDLTTVPEFNPALTADPDAFSLSGTIKDWLGLTEAPPVLTEEQIASLTLRRTTRFVQEAIRIVPFDETYLFGITVRSLDGALAAEIANTLGELYIETQREKKFATTELAIDWLSERVRELEVTLREGENEFRTLQSQADLVNRDVLEGLNLQAKDFRDRLEDVANDKAAAETRLGQMQAAALAGDVNTIVTVFQDIALRRLASSGASSGGSAQAGSPFMARVETLIEAQRAQIEQLGQREAPLAQSLIRLEEQIESQTADLQRLEQMERELNVTRDLYQTFLTGLQEVTVQVGLVQADTRLMSRALPPLQPAAVNTYLMMMVSALLGGLLAAVYLLVREAMNDTFRTSEDLESLSGQLVLGQVPRIPARRRRDVVTYLRTKPTSGAVEAVRNLRTSLLLSDAEKQPQLIVLTSSIPGEGKTTLALALAINLAGLGKKVLLIEGDLRRCTLGEYFQAQGEGKNFLEVLKGNMSLSDAVFHNTEDSVDVLLGQPSDINPADIFSSQPFAELLAQAREAYDYIIIDTPPVLVVPDARIVAREADAVLFAVRWDSTPRPQVLEGLHQLTSTGQPITGLALTQLNMRTMKYYGYSAYGRYARGYYSKT